MADRREYWRQYHLAHRAERLAAMRERYHLQKAIDETLRTAYAASRQNAGLIDRWLTERFGTKAEVFSSLKKPRSRSVSNIIKDCKKNWQTSEAAVKKHRERFPEPSQELADALLQLPNDSEE